MAYQACGFQPLPYRAFSVIKEEKVKTYTLQDVTKHANIGAGQKNIFELISRWPGYGAGFKLYKKQWPKDCFFHAKEVMVGVSLMKRLTSLERAVRQDLRVLLREGRVRQQQGRKAAQVANERRLAIRPD